MLTAVAGLALGVGTGIWQWALPLTSHLVIHRVRVERNGDARLVAVVRLDVVLHPAGEQHQQPIARAQVYIGVPVGYAALDVTVDHSWTRIAEHEFAGTGRHLQI